MLRCLVFVLSLLVWGPIFSQKGNIQIFGDVGYPFTTSEFGDNKFIRFPIIGDSLFECYKILPNGNFETLGTEIWNYRGDTLYSFPRWFKDGESIYEMGRATILEDTLYSFCKPYLNIYDSEMNLKKHLFLPGDDFYYPSYQPIIIEDSIYFAAFKVRKDTFVQFAGQYDSIYCVKWDLNNSTAVAKSFAIDMVELKIKFSVPSSNGNGLLLFNGFGQDDNKDRAFYVNLVDGELEQLDLDFVPNPNIPVNASMISGSFYENPNESDTSLCFRSRYPLVLDDYPDFESTYPEVEYFYYFNDRAEILGHSSLIERDYRFFVPGYSNETGMSGELFKQVGRFFSSVTEPYDSINPNTGMLFEDGYMYFEYDFVNKKFIEQRYVSREDGVGDYYANPTFHHSCYRDFIFKDTVTLVQHSNITPSYNYFNLFSIAISDMTLALPEISGKQLNFSVYPNPTTEKIRVLGSNKGTYQIFNVSGQEVKSGVFYEREAIPIAFLSSGEYIIRVQEDNISGSFKFVKE